MLLQLLCDGCAVYNAFEQAFVELQELPEYQHILHRCSGNGSSGSTGAEGGIDAATADLHDRVQGLRHGLQHGANCALERLLQVRDVDLAAFVQG